uniref:GRAM domain-containing protein n=3 Tax=Caenorhabditis japonica TaxID=281687 RepID=A0A8R1E6G2_CAEJA
MMNFALELQYSARSKIFPAYSCAYQREILAQGRMFISQFNVCFYANIIGWETTLVIPMKDIKLIKKMKAAFIFPNSIQFENENDEKHFFASFINRDKSYQVLTTAHQKSLTAERPMTREEVWDMVYNSEEKVRFSSEFEKVYSTHGCKIA